MCVLVEGWYDARPGHEDRTNEMNTWEALYGPNVGYALELYERYQDDPASVDSVTRAFFDQLALGEDDGAAIAALARPSTRSTYGQSGSASPATAITGDGSVRHNGSSASSVSPEQAPRQRAAMVADSVQVHCIVVAARLARSIREYGHLAASIDPLGRPGPGDPMLEPSTHNITDDDLRILPASIVWPDAGADAGTCLDAINRLRDIYCGPIGFDFDHVQDYDERQWLHGTIENASFRAPLSADARRDLLRRLTEVEGLEKFLHTKFLGQKRFSIEGNDALVPLLDALVESAAASGTREILIGMAHRGRLNVLAHVLGKPYAAIYSEFQSAPNKDLVPSEGSTGINRGWSGDVKYHLGARKLVRDGETVRVQLTLADNPSHLEFVNPVVEGFARAAQDSRDEPGAPKQDVKRALPITIHGDAAFPGEGVVAETLNLSRLAGYQTGGTVRIIVNNQVGFTTGAHQGRSTLYASDLAKGYEIPIVHVNADDPEACLEVVRLAHAYRERFHKDFLIDLVGYRRWGHNEGDEPSFTQPDLYAAISSHETVRALYAQRLIDDGIVSQEDVEALQREVRQRLEQALETGEGKDADDMLPLPEATTALPETAVSQDTLRELNRSLLVFPGDFTLNAKLERVLQRRHDACERPGGIDWALAENLAFASILADGTPIRLTGQDSERGTFSQRHLVLHDPTSGAVFTPLQSIPQARASFAVYNSPLTEAATLGFEYGYTVHAPDAMIMWEAQYGDFANAGQVVLDQFIMAARAKWRQQPALVLLLPHGYEGQGPEHSSARIERYLQLAAEDNVRVAICTTAGQYFHLLRLQAATLRGDRRPLVMMTPKSLLRNPLAASSIGDLAHGGFQPVLDDLGAVDRRGEVERLVLCTGKVAIDLTTTSKAQAQPVHWVAVARVEQLYPFPARELERVIAGYPNVREVVWLQEEPRNMGAWSFVAPRLQELLAGSLPLRYVGRSERSSPAEGMTDAHAREQTRIVNTAFAGERQARIETYGGMNGD
ncbi:MAG: 2-oxoglutarate dehydrogenase E1 component [Chloroflexota bacterium]